MRLDSGRPDNFIFPRAPEIAAIAAIPVEWHDWCYLSKSVDDFWINLTLLVLVKAKTSN